MAQDINRDKAPFSHCHHALWFRRIISIWFVKCQRITNICECSLQFSTSLSKGLLLITQQCNHLYFARHLRYCCAPNKFHSCQSHMANDILRVLCVQRGKTTIKIMNRFNWVITSKKGFESKLTKQNNSLSKLLCFVLSVDGKLITNG